MDDDKKADGRIEGDNNELNINDCSPLRPYSNFKNAIFPHPQQRRPQGRKKFSCNYLINGFCTYNIYALNLRFCVRLRNIHTSGKCQITYFWQITSKIFIYENFE